MASFHLALSTYFVKRRGMAMGIAMTVTGLGPVIMPLLIAYLMSVFGGRGTVLLLSGFVLHSVLGGLLLQPVKWHRKSVRKYFIWIGNSLEFSHSINCHVKAQMNFVEERSKVNLFIL